jgi:hypothetical protein
VPYIRSMLERQAEQSPSIAAEPTASDGQADGHAEDEPEQSEQDSRMIGAHERPGGAVPLVEHVNLIVYPFQSFVVLNEFQSAVRRLRGVSGVRVRRFYKGTLHLAVEYEDVVPLTQRLKELPRFAGQVVAEARGEVELKLEGARPLVSAEGDR